MGNRFITICSKLSNGKTELRTLENRFYMLLCSHIHGVYKLVKVLLTLNLNLSSESVL